MARTSQVTDRVFGYLVLVVLVALAAVACGDAQEHEDRRRADAPGMMGGGMMRMMMRNMPAGIAADELPDPESRSARLVARYCSQCHGIPSPARQSATDWAPTVRRMLARMERMESMAGMMDGRGMRGGMPRIEAPEPEETRAILDYLQTHALRAVEESELPAPGSPGASLFTEVCSGCHALPHPAQRTAEEWPGVVDRMRTNMRRVEVEQITDQRADSIIAYLQRAAEP